MADRAEALRARLLATFRIEAAEHLQAIGAELDALANDPSARSHLEDLFRAMHTLKGAARSVGLGEFEGACHRCETILSDLIRSGAALEPQVVRELQDAGDLLAAFVAGSAAAADLERAAAGDRAPAPAASEPPAAPAAASAPLQTAHEAAAMATIRVETGRLDQLVAMVENLLSPKLAAEERARSAARLVENLQELRARGAGEDTSEDLHGIETRARELANALRADQLTLRTTVDELYEEMLRVRLMPASSILESFPRMVRDLCRDTGKDVTWRSSGEHLEIDRKVLELVKDPLIHMVRNAVDHGIEAPDERVAAGKPRTGNVSVTIAPADGGRIAIEIADDGKGFAVSALREAAVRARLASAEKLAAMSDEDVTELAYNAGVSTSPVVTTISGHGRGLAIVRERIERVGGLISTRSNPGAGTVIRLELPASIVTYRALLLQAGGLRLLLPLEAVEAAFALSRANVAAAIERRELTRNGLTLPFGGLAAVLGLPRGRHDDERRELPCLEVRSGERRGFVLVDEVVGELEVVVKDLRPPLLRVRHILAAGLLGTGELLLILRPLDVLLSLNTLPAQDAEPLVQLTRRIPRVLVVDDSMTTRTMERNLFEAAGYRVHVAADGLDGWNLLQTEDIDVVVSDIDMPRMNGFELTSRIRAHPSFTELPIVLVTALEAREDKERGLRVGANAYVLKSGFDQSNLLEIVRRLT